MKPFLASIALVLLACEPAPVTTGAVVSPAGAEGSPAAAGADPAALAAATPAAAPIGHGHEGSSCGDGAACEGSGCPLAEEHGKKGETVAAAPASAPHAAEGGCPHDLPAAAGAPSPDGTGSTHFGAAFSLPETKPLADLLGGATPPEGTVVRVSGTIDQVCQKKGCWMVIADGESRARILMKDHAFTVPLDVKGRAAVVEGTLKVRTFTEAQVKHLEEDRGGDPSKVSGTRQEVVLTASGVAIRG